jgi:hypothetical protein
LNAALLDQFVSVIPGAMFEKAMSQLISEGESTNFTRKDNTTQNLVNNLLVHQSFAIKKNVFFLKCSPLCVVKILLTCAAWIQPTPSSTFVCRYPMWQVL